MYLVNGLWQISTGFFVVIFRGTYDFSYLLKNMLFEWKYIRYLKLQTPSLSSYATQKLQLPFPVCSVTRSGAGPFPKFKYHVVVPNGRINTVPLLGHVHNWFTSCESHATRPITVQASILSGRRHFPKSTFCSCPLCVQRHICTAVCSHVLNVNVLLFTTVMHF